MNYSTTSRDTPKFQGDSTFSAPITEELRRYDEKAKKSGPLGPLF